MSNPNRPPKFSGREQCRYWAVLGEVVGPVGYVPTRWWVHHFYALSHVASHARVESKVKELEDS